MYKVSVLLIGIGGYGENYVKEFLENDIPDAYLKGVADPFAFKSPYAAGLEKRGIHIYASPEEFYMKEGSADLAVISSPIHTHCRYINTALENGSNVLTEKPVVISVSKMEELIEKEKNSKGFVAVGYQQCYARDVLALKQDILDGVFGSPIRMRSLRLMRRGDKYYSRSGWAGKLSCHGEYVFDSPLANACAHQVQNMLFLLGGTMDDASDIESLEGVLYKGRPSIENFDACALKIRTAVGIDAYYYTAHCVDSTKVGPIGTYEFENGTIEEDSGVFIAHMKDGTVRDYSAIDKGHKMQKLYDAIEGVKTGVRPHCTLEASVPHVKTVLLAENLPVYLRYDAERKTINDDSYYAIPGLEDEYLDCYRNWKLPETHKAAFV